MGPSPFRPPLWIPRAWKTQDSPSGGNWGRLKVDRNYGGREDRPGEMAKMRKFSKVEVRKIQPTRTVVQNRIAPKATEFGSWAASTDKASK